MKAFTNLYVKKELVKAKPFEKQDPDVVKEAALVKSLKPKECNIRLANLRKVYASSG